EETSPSSPRLSKGETMKVSILRWIGLGILVAAGLLWPAPASRADDDERQSVTVAFGRGLNTAQVGNVVNHAILPNNIKIKQDGVVQFLVAGFHEPVIFAPGINDQNIRDFIKNNNITGTFIFDPTKSPPPGAFYFGINPAGGPLNTPATP